MDCMAYERDMDFDREFGNVFILQWNAGLELHEWDKIYIFLFSVASELARN